ncbi:MAG: MBL fold metallo-hydrolase [Candidatus Latescibacteria bacterium]|nr:MBL fold metallo-hydrolase [Candidatus Latescibacterota bacterium]
MEITCFGACGEVTGSCHRVKVNRSNILLDCGMFQGRRKEADEKNQTISFDPQSILNVILSHAHIDHSGRLPFLSSKGFTGSIITHRATEDACKFMLKDSAHIQESDAEYLNYKTTRAFLSNQITSKKNKKNISKQEMASIKTLLKKDKWYLNKEKIWEVMETNNLPMITPLYTMEDAEDCLKLFQGYPYGTTVEVGKNLSCTLYDAGHILGSAITILEANSNGSRTTIGFSGDLGRFDVPILRDPTLDFPAEHRKLDLLMLESTYGNRLHEPSEDMEAKLSEVITKTINRGGSVVIPSFAMERTQTLVYMLHELYNKNKIPHIPVYIDSPLALNLTEVFGEHPECYDRETHKSFLENNENPFSFKTLNYIQSVEESMMLNRNQNPHIVISASGMCESGRILHHLRFRIHNKKNTILFVGYQAANTLGRRIIELAAEYKNQKGNAPLVRFMNKEYPLNAEVVELNGFSGHADRDEIIRFLTKSNLSIDRIALVHGEEEATQTLADNLKGLGMNVFIPRLGESFKVK